MPVSRHLPDGETLMYTIYWHSQPSKKGVLPPEECDLFVWKIIADFRLKMGESPTLLLIPENHTGEEHYGDYITVRREATPHGHYYLGYDKTENGRGSKRDTVPTEVR